MNGTRRLVESLTHSLTHSKVYMTSPVGTALVSSAERSVAVRPLPGGAMAESSSSCAAFSGGPKFPRREKPDGSCDRTTLSWWTSEGVH